MMHDVTIEDEHGRSFRTLRVSITNACNSGCVYCVNGEDKGGINTLRIDAPAPLTHSVLAELVLTLHRVLRLNTVRLTGGEPTLYYGLIPFIRTLKANGIETITMTTNGFLLKQLSAGLAEAGVRDINVSLDAMDPKIFTAVAKRAMLPHVLEGIAAARDCGIGVKLNAVIMRGVNENQILPLLDYAIQGRMELRYLELMRMGHFYSKNYDRYFFSMNEICRTIASAHVLTPLHRSPSATAQRWRLEDGNVFGIIANESEPFCSDCDRLRLDSFGNIYGCLSDEKREYVGDSTLDEQVLTERLQQALTHKQPIKFKGSPLTMISIGG